MRAATLVTAIAGAHALASPAAHASSVSCTVDGKPWEVKQPVQALVATRPMFGAHLTIDIRGAAQTQLPYLQVAAQWKRLEGKSNVTLKAKNAEPEGPLEAMWTETAPKPAPALGEPQPGVHYLERGELKLIRHDQRAGTLTLKLDFTMREGAYDRAARNGGNHKVDVRCTLDAIPVRAL